MIFKCVSCQHEHVQRAGYWVPPSQCEKCGGGVTLMRDTEPPPDGEPKADGLPRPATPAKFPMKGPRVFLSTMLYSLSRELGPADAIAELGRQVNELAGDGPIPEQCLPVASLIARARMLWDVQTLIDAGASHIAKARCRAAHQFLKSECDVWIMADDDVDASSLALQALYEAVDHGAPSVCVAPCLLRRWSAEEHTLPPLANVAFEQVVVDRELPSGGKVRSVLFGGFGLVAISREALQRCLGEHLPRFVDDDGEIKVAFFDNAYEPHRPTTQREEGEALLYDWYGEDIAFFQMLPPSVRAEALLTGHTKHAGELLNLSEPYTPSPVRQSFTRRAVAATTEQKVLKQKPAEAPSISPEHQALLAQHEALLKQPPPPAAAEGQADEQEQPEASPEL
jgi:hypothetical protein